MSEILENDQLRAEVSSIGAQLQVLQFKPMRLDMIRPDDGQAPNGAGSLLQNAPFEVRSELRDEKGSRATFAATAQGFDLARTYSIPKNEACVSVEETLSASNESELNLLWGWRIALATPFIDSSCRIETPAVSYFDSRDQPILRLRWPTLANGTNLATARCAGAESRRLFLTDFNEGLCAIENASRKMRMELRWDPAPFPYCWIEEKAGQLSMGAFSGLPSAAEDGHGLITVSRTEPMKTRFEVRVAQLA